MAEPGSAGSDAAARASTDSGRITSSESTRRIHSPRISRIAAFIECGMLPPSSRSTLTRPPYPRTTSSVPSVEPASTTIISVSPYVWLSADSTHSPM